MTQYEKPKLILFGEKAMGQVSVQGECHPGYGPTLWGYAQCYPGSYAIIQPCNSPETGKDSFCSSGNIANGYCTTGTSFT